MRTIFKSLGLALLFVSQASNVLARRIAHFQTPTFLGHDIAGGTTSLESVLSMRGGAKKKTSRTGSLTKSSKTVTGKKKVGERLKADKKSAKASDFVTDIISNIRPLTKIYFYMVAACTVLGLLLGDERSQAVMALDPMRTLYGGELWRPFTAASYLGKPSVGWLMSVYYLVQYGNQLEIAYGPAQFLIFLLSQLVALSFLSMLFRQPTFGGSVVTAMLHVISRITPKQKVKWLIMDVPYWFLPCGFLIADCLQAQSAAAAVPHIVGILSGHFYLFHRFIWPKVGGEDWLSAPDFLIERMDPNAAKQSAAKSSLSKALKSRKRGKGKKLGR